MVGPLVLIAPHPDDEIISGGGYIAAHLNAGRTVHVHIVYDGTVTKATTNMQGTYPGITAEAVGQARRIESRAGLLRLGVPPQGIHFEMIRDGTGTQNGVAESVVSKLVRQYGLDADYVTQSWMDKHPDHAALGAALRALPPGPRRRYLVSPLYWPDSLWNSSWPALPGRQTVALPPLSVYTTPTGYVAAHDLAIAEHYLVAPEEGRYGINARWSVGYQFAVADAAKRSVYHA